MRKHLNTFDAAGVFNCDEAWNEKWEYYFIVWAFSSTHSAHHELFAEIPKFLLPVHRSVRIYVSIGK